MPGSMHACVPETQQQVRKRHPKHAAHSTFDSPSHATVLQVFGRRRSSAGEDTSREAVLATTDSTPAGCR